MIVLENLWKMSVTRSTGGRCRPKSRMAVYVRPTYKRREKPPYRYHLSVLTIHYHKYNVKYKNSLIDQCRPVKLHT